MTDVSIKAAIDDARALLDAVLASDWREIHIESGGTEIFIAREGGGANPMRASPEPAGEVLGKDATTSTVMAPHVATLVSVAVTGSVVRQGDIVATIAVLDEQEAVPAPVSGRVATVYVEEGALIEFKTPILDIVTSVA